MNDIDPLIRDFETGTLDPARFGHREHLYAAHWYLRQYSLDEALPRFVAALKRLTRALGVAHKYHATMTWGYLVLLDEAMRRAPNASFEALLEQNPQLLLPGAAALEPYYTRDQLDSGEARSHFVLPRRA